VSAGRDATALREAVATGERSAREVVQESLDAIARLDGTACAFHAVHAERALARADELDAARAAGGEPGALCGVPVALKSNLCLEETEVNCGSRILAGYRAPYTATSVARLLEAGAVPVGMTHMDEFAMGSSGENSAWATARNPWDVERIPGGSSSGSAVAVASGMVPLALGSDTGGSVRQPAALCGIVGFKPTYGRVSRYGLVAFGSSLDQVSPLARSVRDVARTYDVLAGHDPLDSTSLEAPGEDGPALAAEGSAPLGGLRIGVPEEFFPAALEEGVGVRVRAAIETLEGLGAETVPVELPHTEQAIATYYVVATAEASSNLARYDGVRYGLRAEGDGSLQGMISATREAGFGDEVKRRILLGTYVLSSGYYDAWYGRALRVRSLLRAGFEAAFERADVLVGPTSPTVAFPLGERTDDPVSMYLADVLTVPASLAGLPAVSVPCGLAEPAPSPAGSASPPLPVGLQIVGPRLADRRVLAVASAFESATDFGSELPALHASRGVGGAGR